MSHSSILFQDNFFGCLSKTYCLLLSSRFFGRQYIIILEAGRWPICFQVIMFNVYFLMRLGQLLLTTRLNRIRTATRDGDRAVGVNRTVAVEPCPSPSNQISQYQMFSQKGIIVIQISIAQINLINMIHCIHNLNWVLFYKRQINKC